MNLKPIISYFKTFPETGLIIINFAICGIKRKKKSLPPIARTVEKKTKINQSDVPRSQCDDVCG